MIYGQSDFMVNPGPTFPSSERSKTYQIYLTYVGIDSCDILEFTKSGPDICFNKLIKSTTSRLRTRGPFYNFFSRTKSYHCIMYGWVWYFFAMNFLNSSLNTFLTLLGMYFCSGWKKAFWTSILANIRSYQSSWEHKNSGDNANNFV